jgi:hypothetical protein
MIRICIVREREREICKLELKTSYGWTVGEQVSVSDCVLVTTAVNTTKVPRFSDAKLADLHFMYCSCHVAALKEYQHRYGDLDCLCGLVVRVPGYRSKGPGPTPYATRLSE